MVTLAYGEVLLVLQDGFLVRAEGRGKWKGFAAYPYRGNTVATEVSDLVETPYGLRYRADCVEADAFASLAEEALEELWPELYRIAETACTYESGEVER